MREHFAENMVAVDANGRKHVVINWILTQDEFDQMRLGYMCVNCKEPFREAFPKTCFICDFPVRDRQLEFLERDHQGEKHYGPTPLSKLDEMDAEQAERDRAGWTQTGSGIVVPATIKERM